MTEAVESKHFMQKLGELDRRIIYIVMLIAVIVPTVTPLSLPVSIGAMTKVMFNYIEDNIEPGDHVIMIGQGINPADMLDRGWMWVAFIRHLWGMEGPAGEHVRITVMSYAGFSEEVETVFKWAVGDKLGTEFIYGVDYVNLGQCLSFDVPGYKTTAEDTGWCGNVADHYGTPLDDLPLTQETKGFKINDFDMVVLVAGIGYSVSQQMGQWSPYFPGGKTNVMMIGYPMILPIWMPYAATGQILGVTNGLRGAAEYEGILEQEGVGVPALKYGTFAIDAYNTSHLAVCIFLIMGNVSYLYTRFVLKKEE
jgi:hypothetical protein